jgi:hypothetical protein
VKVANLGLKPKIQNKTEKREKMEEMSPGELEPAPFLS